MKIARLSIVLTAFILTFGMAQNPVRVGLEAVGTFSWITYAMEHYGINQELDLDVETTTYATKQAKELALRAGEADIVVDDFVAPVLWREQGIPARAVYPYSLATGGVVVRADSDIQSVEDLRGRTIAATSLRDKSLLILRTLTVSQHGFDPQVDGEVIAAAPPLMEELLSRGEVDAVIPPWHIIARMVGTGEYREVIMNAEMLEEMGMPSELPILVVIARDDMEPEVLSRFLQGMEMAVERMRGDEEIWDLILAEELYSLPDPSLFPDVVERWELGLPQVWNEEVVSGLVELVEEMVALAGAEVVGAERFDPEAYATEFAPAMP